MRQYVFSCSLLLASGVGAETTLTQVEISRNLRAAELWKNLDFQSNYDALKNDLHRAALYAYNQGVAEILLCRDAVAIRKRKNPSLPDSDPELTELRRNAKLRAIAFQMLSLDLLRKLPDSAFAPRSELYRLRSQVFKNLIMYKFDLGFAADCVSLISTYISLDPENEEQYPAHKYMYLSLLEQPRTPENEELIRKHRLRWLELEFGKASRQYSEAAKSYK